MSDASPRIDDDEAAGAESSAPAQKRLDPGFKRNIKIIAGAFGLLLLILMLLWLRSGTTKSQPGAASQVVLGATTGGAVDNMTPEMKVKLAQKQKDEAADAARGNRSYVPPDTPSGVVPVQTYAGPGESTMAQTAAPITNYARTNSEEDTRRREGLNRMLMALAGEEAGAPGSVRQTIRTEQGDRQNGDAQLRQSLGSGVVSVGRDGVIVGAAPGGTAGTGTAAPAGAVKSRQIIPGLEISAGQLSSELNVPANASVFASARVSSGPAAGGFMIGTAKVVDEGLEINFTQLRLGDRTYRIDAIALDEQTAGAAISGSVDRRVLQRYVMPVALAMAQGFYSAKSQTGSTVVNVNTGSTGVATPPSNAEQARAAGVAAGLQIAGQVVQQQAQAPIVVSRASNYPIGVLFRQPVMEEVTR